PTESHGPIPPVPHAAINSPTAILHRHRLLDFFSLTPPLADLPPFPARRSSDLTISCCSGTGASSRLEVSTWRRSSGLSVPRNVTDRKSTRLNSSHVKISYAVFCLKKKNHT